MNDATSAPHTLADSGTAWLVAIVLIAAVVRVPMLLIGTWADEGLTYVDVHAATWPSMFARIWAAEGNPPLYFLIERTWTGLFGYSSVALKLPSLIFNLATIPVVGAIGRRIGGSLNGLVAAAIFAALPVSIWNAQEARPYAAAAFLVALCMLFYIRALERPNDFPVSFTIAACALAYTHYTGLLFLFSLAFLTFLNVRGAQLRNFTFSFVVVGLAFALWLPFFVHHVRAGQPWEEDPWNLRPLILLGYAYASIPLFSFTSVGDFLVSGRYVMGTPLRAFGGFTALAILGALIAFTRAPTSYPGRTQDRILTLIGAVVLLVFFEGALMSAGSIRYAFPVFTLTSVVYAEGMRRIVDALRKNISNLSLGAVIGFLVALTAISVLATLQVSCALPKSGLAELVREAPRGGQTLWMIIPNGGWGASAAYYAQALHREPSLVGFVTWENPEFLDVSGVARRWAHTDAYVGPAMRRIAQMRDNGFQTMIVVRRGNYRFPIADVGSVQFHHANDFVSAIAATYAIVDCAFYPATVEPASMVIFDLRESPRRRAYKGHSCLPDGQPRRSNAL